MVKFSERPNALFKALASPIRQQMVELLARHAPLSLSAIADPVHLSLPGTLKHIRILQKSGIIRCKKKGRVQFCALDKPGAEPIVEWLRSQGFFWDASLLRLNALLEKRSKKSYERRYINHQKNLRRRPGRRL